MALVAACQPCAAPRARLGGAAPALAQRRSRAAATTTAKPMSSNLVPSRSDARRRRPATRTGCTQRQLRPDPLLPWHEINTGNVARLRPAFVVPDRGDGIDGDGADRRQRRDVPHDFVQPRVRGRRRDRRGVLALQAQDGAGHDLSAAARTTAASRSPATGSTWARSTPSWSRSTPRPARSLWETADRRSRKGLLAKRWRRRSSTARC